jgi:hypothetical protein
MRRVLLSPALLLSVALLAVRCGPVAASSTGPVAAGQVTRTKIPQWKDAGVRLRW